MTVKPYSWQSQHPRHRVSRTNTLNEIVEYARQGRGVKIIGGRGMGKSVLLQDIEIDDYCVDDTRRGIAVTLGARDPEGWPEAYESWCLAGRDFVRLETPSDLVGHWRVRQTDAGGKEWSTDHLLVQLPKRG